MNEPSVLDYVKAKLIFWKKSDISIPTIPEGKNLSGSDIAEVSGISESGHLTQIAPAAIKREAVQIPWMVVLPAAVALLGQSIMELWAQAISGHASGVLAQLAQLVLGPASGFPVIGLFLYCVTAVLVMFSGVEGHLTLVEHKPASAHSEDFSAHWGEAIIGLPMVLASFLLFGGNRFTALNVAVWLMTIALFLYAFIDRQSLPDIGGHIRQAWQFLTKPGRTWNIRVTKWAVLVVAVLGVVLFFRFYRLDQIPIDMVSDHAEKLLDINDVINGIPSIFFERNTGREPFQFYWTVLVIKLFGLTVSFFSLKLGTVLIGLITAYYTYRLGYLWGGKWVALLALLFIGVAYWSNIISRIALRFPLYPFFVAPLLLYLTRGFRTGSRNDFIWAGLWLGIGLNGYTSSRIVPFLVVLAFGLYLLSRDSKGKRRQSVMSLLMVVLFSVLLCLPLGRYALDHKEMFFYRSLTRIGSAEVTIPGNPVRIFISNFWAAITMFFYNNGSIWVHSIPYRPALDIVMGAFFFVGFFLLLARYIKSRRWEDLFLMLSIPMLILPSALSIAFPGENPSLNRTAGVYVPVMVIAAMGVVALLKALARRLPPGQGVRWATLVGLILVVWTISNNYNLFFIQYDKNFAQNAWNTREIGGVVEGFAKLTGTYDTYYVVGFPYWIDSRQVAIFAGHIQRDPGLLPEQIPQTAADPREKMFIIKPEDQTDLDTLRQVYPNGRAEIHHSPLQGKDFIVFLVPAQQDSLQ